MLPEPYFVQWSATQGCFHIATLDDIRADLVRFVSRSYLPDFVTLSVVATRTEAHAVIASITQNRARAIAVRN